MVSLATASAPIFSAYSGVASYLCRKIYESRVQTIAAHEIYLIRNAEFRRLRIRKVLKIALAIPIAICIIVALYITARFLLRP